MSIVARLNKIERAAASVGLQTTQVRVVGGLADTHIRKAYFGNNVVARNDNESPDAFKHRAWTYALGDKKDLIVFGGFDFVRQENNQRESNFISRLLPADFRPKFIRRIELPTLHKGQVDCVNALSLANGGRLPRFTAIRCGRRWGKTVFDQALAIDQVCKGHNVGIFVPYYKYGSEIYNELATALLPIKKSSSKVNGVYQAKTGGRVDLWTLDNPNAGRSRKYHLALIDEAAFTKPDMIDIWQRSIKPALLDYTGSAVVTSTPNGLSADNFFHHICTDPKEGFIEYHAPTSTNPLLPQGEIEKLQRENHPKVFRQEYLAEFVDWSGEAFFSSDKLLLNGQPVAPPTKCDCVFAVIDTATKTGSKRDGTAVIYFSLNRIGKNRLTVLDWDIQQIEGSLLEAWLPTVFENLEIMAKQVGARYGSIGAHIEDKSSGMVLNQQAKRRNWQAHPIDTKLTALGKDERALSVSGYHYREDCKLSPLAYDKVTIYKGRTQNHFLAQVCNFHLGADNQEDDLLDCYCYALSIGLGDYKGF